MRQYVYIISGLVMALMSLTANAQNFEVENSVDAKYTPPEGSIFDSNDKSSNHSEYRNYEYKNAIQFNITGVARGAAALEYERALTSNLVLMGTGGVTVFQDVIKSTVLGFLFDEELFGFNNELDKIGIFWGGEFKGYFGEAFNDDFISFGIRNFNYNLKWTPSSYPTYTNSSLSSFSQTFKESNRDFYIGYGASYILSENLVSEFSVSAGIRRIKSSSFTLEEINDNSGYYTVSNVQLTQTDFVQLVPTFFISYKLGFAFGD